ncbi:hypothetical protein ABT366_04085 [Streptomyces lydicus]|uniref:hypothetical protein n=1 Tax=Streptomyces lydicus TaxID=47763 RepID=UPI00332F9B61
MRCPDAGRPPAGGPYTKDGVQIPGLPAHEGKGWLNDISPSSGVAVGTAMFPHGIPPITPVDQAQIWPGSGPVRTLPSLAPTARPAPRPSMTRPGRGVGPTTAIRTTAPVPRTR